VFQHTWHATALQLGASAAIEDDHVAGVEPLS
jgi:hypothetical protein